MQIYIASLRHLEKILPLFHSYRKFYSQHVDPKTSEEFIRKNLTDTSAIIFIAEVDQKPVGFMQLYLSKSSVKAVNEMILNDLFVLEEYRKQGVAKKLIESAKNHALLLGISNIKLETSDTNEIARKLYEKLGFKKQIGFSTYELDMGPINTTKNAPTSADNLSSTLPFWKLANKNSDSNIKLAEQVIVITGVTQGLGEAMLNKFSALGYIVVGCGRNHTKLEALKLRYPKCDLNAVDISHQLSVEEWVNYVINKFGVPKFVINNASIIDNPRRPFHEANLNHLTDVININLLGNIYVTHGFLPYMRRFPNKTTIVNISSGWGRSADVGIAGYCASKFGLEGFTSVIAQENKNILTIVSLDPNEGIATPMLEKCADAAYYNSRPSATEWAEVAVPFILNIKSEQSGQQLTIPEVQKKTATLSGL